MVCFVSIAIVPSFMTPASDNALREAVATIEKTSSVEFVVVVRPRSASYRHVDLYVGMTVALLVLAFLLYSPWPFAWHFFLLNTLVAAIGTSFVCSKLPSLQRALSKEATMHASVQVAARAAFVEQGVHHTQFRTGLVLYLSLLEQSAALVGDSAVEIALPTEEVRALEAKIRDLLQAGKSAEKVAKELAASAELFAKFLPSHEEDRNELADGVVQ